MGNGTKTPEVGKAYRDPDGIVRWCISKSTRNLYQFWWRAEKDQEWYSGSKERSIPDSWEEVPAPQPGETIIRMDYFGMPHETTVPETEKAVHLFKVVATKTIEQVITVCAYDAEEARRSVASGGGNVDRQEVRSTSIEHIECLKKFKTERK